jgi:hypothetical protein
MRASRPALALAAATALALPAAAQASTASVVTLSVPASTTCERVVADVTADYGVTPAAVYTSALCGFSSSLSRKTARLLSADPRVVSVEADTVIRTV